MSRSDSAEDRALAARADRFVRSTPFAIDYMRKRDLAKKQQSRTRDVSEVQRLVTGVRKGPEIER